MQLIAIIESIASYFLLSLGFVLQKKGIGWIGHRGPRDGVFRRSLTFWVLGFILMNLAVIPNFLALNSLSAYVVNAISGLNIVFLIFLSKFILGEKVLITDYFYSGLMIIAIVAINLMETGASHHPTLNQTAAYGFAILPMALFFFFMLLSTLKKLPEKRAMGETVLLAALGGGMSGYAVTFMKILQMQSGPFSQVYLLSPFLYGYIAVSVLSFIALQIAYKNGSMIIVGPVQYAMTVFYPIAAAYLIFSLPINPIQIVAFLLIVVSVVLMVHQHQHETKRKPEI